MVSLHRGWLSSPVAPPRIYTQICQHGLQPGKRSRSSKTSSELLASPDSTMDEGCCRFSNTVSNNCLTCHQIYWLPLKDRDHWKLTRPSLVYPGARKVNERQCNYRADDLILLIMDGWFGINSLPSVLTMQLGLEPQLSLQLRLTRH